MESGKIQLKICFFFDTDFSPKMRSKSHNPPQPLHLDQLHAHASKVMVLINSTFHFLSRALKTLPQRVLPPRQSGRHWSFWHPGDQMISPRPRTRCTVPAFAGLEYSSRYWHAYQHLCQYELVASEKQCNPFGFGTWVLWLETKQDVFIAEGN